MAYSVLQQNSALESSIFYIFFENVTLKAFLYISRENIINLKNKRTSSVD
jgi:hypothetical protein